MTKEEFKKTIEYKERMRVIKFFVGLLIFVYVMYGFAAIISFLLIYKLDLNKALLVFFSIIIIGPFFVSLVLGILIHYRRKKLKSVLNNLDKMYVFESWIKKPVVNGYFHAKYSVTFIYNNEKFELVTDWIHERIDLNNQKVSIGFIEELNAIYVLNKM